MSKAVEIVAILDRSSSMSGMESAVRKSFNDFIKEQKAVEGKANVTLVFFDHEYQVIHSRKKLSKIKKLKEKDFKVRGATALYDAIGNAINSVHDAKKAIFLIQTDGYENASREFTNKDIKSLIEKKTANGWKFIFAGSGLPEYEVVRLGDLLSIPRCNTIAINQSAQGFQDLGATYASVTTSYRTEPDSNAVKVQKQFKEGTAG